MQRTAETDSRRAPALDPSLVAVASLASVCSAIAASAFGTGPVATLVVAAISPWIVAFISHPGPRRRRRVAAVVFLAGLVHAMRTGVARAAAYLRHPRDRDRRRARQRAANPSNVGRRAPRRLSLAACTTVGAVAVCAFCLTVPELVFGAAVVADRPLTLVPVAEHRVDGPRAAGPQRGGPTLTVPGADVRRLAAGPRGARVTYRVLASDARGAALTPDCHPASGRLFAMGQTRVECVATQANGRSARRAFTVTVVPVIRPRGEHADARAPRLSTPGDIVREVGQQAALRVTFAVSALDGADGPLTASCHPASGATFAVGATRVTCTATDSAGHTGRASFTVVVRHTPLPTRPDTAPPRLSLPGTVHARASTPLGAIVTFAARAVDTGDRSVDVACAPRSGTRFAVGRTRVACTATDSAGNTARGGFAVVVAPVETAPDRSAPEIAVPAVVRAQATSAAGAAVRYRAVAVDERDGHVAVMCSPPSGSMFPVGVTRASCTASDRAGNRATRRFAVVVVRASEEHKPPTDGPPGPTSPSEHPPTTTPSEPDRTAPRMGAFRLPVVATDTRKGAVVSYRPPRAVDDRDGPVPVDCTPSSGTWFPVGETTVTCTARDQAGNSSQRSAVATVRLRPDAEPPRIDPFTIPTVTAGTSEGAIVAYDTPAAVDNRDGPVPVTCSPESGSRFPTGSTEVTCTARDSTGNTATERATATVEGIG
jgi:HYR domain